MRSHLQDPSSACPTKARRFGVLRELAWLLAYLGGACIFTYPLILDLAGSVTDFADPLLNSWTLAWGSHQWLHDPLHLFDANVLYPAKNTLARFDHLTGLVLLVAPVQWVFGKPVATHNVALLLSIAISGYGTHRLLRHLTGSSLAAAVGGSIFAFAPYRAGQLSHVQLQAAGFIPLIYLYLDRYVEEGRARNAFFFALFIWLTSASSGYYGVFTWILLGLAVPYQMWRRPAMTRRRAIGLALALAMSALAYLPLAVPYIRHGQEGFVRRVERLYRPAAGPQSYLSSPSHLHQATGLERANPEQNLFPGFLALILAAASLLKPDRRTGLFLLVGGVALWASLGPAAGLYRLLYHIVPGVNGLRVPARFGIYVLFAIAVLAGLGSARIFARLPKGKRAYAGMLLAIWPLLESFAGPHSFRRAPEVPQVFEWLVLQPDSDPIVELPMPRCGQANRRGQFNRNFLYFLWSARHFRPMAFRCDLAEQLETFPDAAGLASLVELRVRYVILHRDLYLRARARELEDRMNQQPGLKAVFRTTNETAYEVTLPAIP